MSAHEFKVDPHPAPTSPKPRRILKVRRKITNVRPVSIWATGHSRRQWGDIICLQREWDLQRGVRQRDHGNRAFMASLRLYRQFLMRRLEPDRAARALERAERKEGPADISAINPLDVVRANMVS